MKDWFLDGVYVFEFISFFLFWEGWMGERKQRSISFVFTSHLRITIQIHISDKSECDKCKMLMFILLIRHCHSLVIISNSLQKWCLIWECDFKNYGYARIILFQHKHHISVDEISNGLCSKFQLWILKQKELPSYRKFIEQNIEAIEISSMEVCQCNNIK